MIQGQPTKSNHFYTLVINDWNLNFKKFTIAPQNGILRFKVNKIYIYAENYKPWLKIIKEDLNGETYHIHELEDSL